MFSSIISSNFKSKSLFLTYPTEVLLKLASPFLSVYCWSLKVFLLLKLELIANLFFLLGFCLPYKFYRPIEIIPRKKLNANYSVGAVVCGFAVFVISHFCLLMFVKDIGTSDLSFTGVLYSVLAFSLLGPIAEELFFRQWVISYLTKYNYSNFAKMLQDRSVYSFNTSVGGNDKILTLSTCYSNGEKMVMHAKLIKYFSDRKSVV